MVRGEPRVRCARDIASVPGPEGSGVAYVAALPDGPILVLSGSAQVIWTELRAGPGWAGRVAEAFDVAPESICAELEDFLSALRRARLIIDLGT